MGLLSRPPATIDPARYQRDTKYGDSPGSGTFGRRSSVEMEHLDGVPWWDAPVPRRWHRCWVQTKGWTSFLDGIERCACGAIRMIDLRRYYGQRSHWMDRNSSSREKSLKPRVTPLVRKSS